jgi:predicted metal-dependent hydrolase
MSTLLHRDILLCGRGISYHIRRNPRARRVLLKVEDDLGLVVVLPRWFAARDVPQVLEKHARWILDTLGRREIKLAALDRAPGEPPWALFAGQRLPLRFVSEPARYPPLLTLEEGELVLRCAPPEPGGPALTALLSAWYRSQARLRYPARVAHWAGVTGLTPRSMRIGDPKTRWGSCSASGAVSLSWRLILAPAEVLDYLVVHELCHMKHPDHSTAFWNLVGAHLPGYTRPREWLRHQGVTLRTHTARTSHPVAFLDAAPDQTS